MPAAKKQKSKVFPLGGDGVPTFTFSALLVVKVMVFAENAKAATATPAKASKALHEEKTRMTAGLSKS